MDYLMNDLKISSYPAHLLINKNVDNKSDR